MRSRSTARRALLMVLAMLVLLPVLPAHASPKAKPNAFEVRLHPDSQPHWTAPPESESSRHVVTASDGVQLFVEVWQPAQKPGGPPVPEEVPTILLASPYAKAGKIREFRVARGRPIEENGVRDGGVIPYGFAWAQMHLRGTGASGGCMQFNSEQEADDVARVVEHLVRQPWSDGTVGGYGISHDAGALLNAAGRRDRRDGGELFQAIVAIAPSGSWYDAHWTFDGVRIAPISVGSAAVYFGSISQQATMASAILGGETDVLGATAQRAECVPDAAVAAADPTGDFTAWYADRESRAWAPQITTPVLMTHGHYDLTPAGGSPPSQQAGLFDRLGGPKAGLFGAWGHESPDWHWMSGLYEEWRRADFPAMRTAWFDHWVRGLDSDVDRWPVAQVQGSDGQWRAEPDWPATGGRAGHLALGPGILGASAPIGESWYQEGALETRAGQVAGSFLEFVTEPLPDRLEITGQPVLDLLVRLEQHDPRERDAHIAARLEVLGADGRPLGHKGRQAQRTHATFGLRSARHITPMTNGYFDQKAGLEPPEGWFRVPVRFQPTDLVVPAGGRLRITIAGSLIPGAGADQIAPYFAEKAWDPARDTWNSQPGNPPIEQVVDDPLLFPSLPSGSAPVVRVSHDCGVGVSALRFLMPDRRPHLLDVAESHEEPLGDEPATTFVSDAGGLATAPVCGQQPRHPAAEPSPQ